MGCKTLGKGLSQALGVPVKSQHAAAQLSGARWRTEGWRQVCSWSLGRSIGYCLLLWGHLCAGGRVPLQYVPLPIAAELVLRCPGRPD